MSIIDDVLLKLGLKYEDLTSVEKDTLNSWYQSAQKNVVSVDSIRDYVTAMKDSVEQELEKYNNDSKYDLMLKARLKNYRLMEAFMTSPEKAKAALERYVASLVSPKGNETK